MGSAAELQIIGILDIEAELERFGSTSIDPTILNTLMQINPRKI